MKEIILIGSYQLTKQLNRFITNVQQEFKIVVRFVFCVKCFNMLTTIKRFSTNNQCPVITVLSNNTGYILLHPPLPSELFM